MPSAGRAVNTRRGHGLKLEWQRDGNLQLRKKITHKKSSQKTKDISNIINCAHLIVCGFLFFNCCMEMENKCKMTNGCRSDSLCLLSAVVL